MSTRPVVLITETEYRRGAAVFSTRTDLSCVPTASDEISLSEAVTRSGARYVVVGSVRYGDRLYAALPRRGVIARYGVGHDSVDKALATKMGLFCTNTPDVLHQSVAELTLLMIGAAARHLTAVAAAMERGSWSPRQGIELEHKTLAIIGCGAIGRAVARIAAVGYGMRVVGYRRRAAAAGGEPPEFFDAITDDFTAAVRDADFVSLHIPGSPDNVRFLDAARLSRIPAHAWLINTARGAVVDEAALFDALQEKRLAGAALDVFEQEPYQPRDPARDLRRLPQVILLPHVGSNTAEANSRMAERALRNIQLAEAGRWSDMDLVNPEVLEP